MDKISGYVVLNSNVLNLRQVMSFEAAAKVAVFKQNDLISFRAKVLQVCFEIKIQKHLFE